MIVQPKNTKEGNRGLLAEKNVIGSSLLVWIPFLRDCASSARKSWSSCSGEALNTFGVKDYRINFSLRDFTEKIW